MTQQPPTNLEKFVNEFNNLRKEEGKTPLLDGVIVFYQELVKHRTMEYYFDMQIFAELHQQISDSLDEESLSDEERTDIALLGISLSNLIERTLCVIRDPNYPGDLSFSLSQAYNNFVPDIATRPGVNHAKIFIHALLTLRNKGAELLAQKSVANLPAESVVGVADALVEYWRTNPPPYTQQANCFLRHLIVEQANANKALEAENAALRNTVQSALNGNTNFATTQLSEHVGRGSL
jgi:hypothetical protein